MKSNFYSMPVIEVKNLSVTLNAHRILDGVSFTVDKGDIVAIIGPNGAGKTTLVKAMLGLVPYQGTSTILGVSSHSIQRVAHRIAYVAQIVDFDRTIPITVKELFGLLTPASIKTDPESTLKLVHAERLLHEQLRTLSGGEFQRITIAASLHHAPEVLFFDEPATGVDTEGAGEIYELLSRLRESAGVTVILVSHDINVVFAHATQVICINHQMLCHGKPSETLTPQQLKRLYGREQSWYTHEPDTHHA